MVHVPVTNYGILTSSLLFSKYVPVDKAIISNHMLNGGLRVRLTDDFAPVFDFVPFEGYSPSAGCVNQALKGINFHTRDVVERLFSYTNGLERKIVPDRETMIKGAAIFKDDIINRLGKNHAEAVYAIAVFDRIDEFVAYRQTHPQLTGYERELRQRDGQYGELEREVEAHWEGLQRNHPESLQEYLETHPYSSNDELVNAFYRDEYAKAHTDTRDMLTFNSNLYGWVLDDRGFLGLKSYQDHGNVKQAHIDRFVQYVNYHAHTVLDKAREKVAAIGGNPVEAKEQLLNSTVETYGRNYWESAVVKFMLNV